MPRRDLQQQPCRRRATSGRGVRKFEKLNSGSVSAFSFKLGLSGRAKLVRRCPTYWRQLCYGQTGYRPALEKDDQYQQLPGSIRKRGDGKNADCLAASSILTEYVRAAGCRVDWRPATALFYGIVSHFAVAFLELLKQSEIAPVWWLDPPAESRPRGSPW